MVKDHTLQELDVKLTGVSVLEMAVEDGGDGANSDWGVWISPQLRR
jgi:hypothetical protein